MDDKTRMQALEGALAQMLKPVRGVPFDVIIRALAEKQVVRVQRTDTRDARMLEKLGSAIQACAMELRAKPVLRPRPNEVGNDVEPYVMRALKAVGLRSVRPTSSSGMAKSTGYPDILFYDDDERPTYLECKIFAHGAETTTMRSFFLSPSEAFKVSLDARHLLLAYGMDAEVVPGSRNSLYRPRSFKLVDLHDLLCDVKYEFNSDNRRLYSEDMLLLEGLI